jgi:glyoxylase-like metal-dependent hydrolase (beta-lactamase superfamily II)
MKIIAPNLYTFTGLPVGRVYMIEDPDGLTIIDGGLALATNRILSQITASGHKLTDIKRILLTHAHLDHIGALPTLRERSGAAIITSEIEKPIAEGAISVPRANPADVPPLPRAMLLSPPMTLKGITVDRTVKDGDVIEALGGLQVVATPGHSPGHLCFWQPDRKILFTGDVMMYLLGRLRLPLAAFTPDMAENIRSIKKVAALDVEVACFGHGEPLTQNTAATIRAFAQRVGAV